MKINFDAVITDLKGRTINEVGGLWRAPQDGENTDAIPEKMTLGFVAMTALNHGAMEDKSYKRARERYALMEKVYGVKGGGVQDLTAAEVTLIQEQIAKVFAPMIVGRAGDLLEPQG